MLSSLPEDWVIVMATHVTTRKKYNKEHNKTWSDWVNSNFMPFLNSFLEPADTGFASSKIISVVKRIVFYTVWPRVYNMAAMIWGCHSQPLEEKSIWSCCISVSVRGCKGERVAPPWKPNHSIACLSAATPYFLVTWTNRRALQHIIIF